MTSLAGIKYVYYKLSKMSVEFGLRVRARWLIFRGEAARSCSHLILMSLPVWMCLLADCHYYKDVEHKRKMFGYQGGEVAEVQSHQVFTSFNWKVKTAVAQRSFPLPAAFKVSLGIPPVNNRIINLLSWTENLIPCLCMHSSYSVYYQPAN